MEQTEQENEIKEEDDKNDIFGKPMKYKEICRIFDDEEYTRGNQRANQLKRWQKNFIIEKNKTFYTIIRPLTEAEWEIVNNENTFVANIERILLYEIKKQDCNYQVVLSKQELLESLKLVNDKYYKAKFKEFKKYLDEIIEENRTLFGYNGNIDDKNFAYMQAENELKTYFAETNGLLTATLNSCFKSMAKRDLIIYSKSFKLFKDDKYHTKHICTTKEDSIILGIIDEVKKEMNISGSLHFLPFKEKRKYYDKINEKVKEKFGYDYCHEAIRIILSESAIKRDLDKMENVIKAMINNNEKSVKKLNSSKVLNDKMSTKRVECFTDKLIKY